MTSETDGITTIDFYYSGQQIIEERTGVTNATGGSTGSNGSVTEELVYSPDYVNDVLSRDTYVSGSYSSRVFFTHDANYDVTGVVQNSTSGTMLQRMTYDAYGNVTFLTSSWTTTTDSYGVENLWQGGWRDVNTGYYHFQERWYSPSMQWLSWDPANYPDGPSAYLPIMDDPINGRDSSGEITVRTVSNAPSRDGSMDVKWNFILDNPAPADGYIVQENTITSDITVQAPNGTPSRRNPPPFTFWEAWHVKKGQLWPEAMLHFNGNYTDHVQHGVEPGSKGTFSVNGDIKFSVTCGILGSPTPISKPAIQPSFESGFIFGDEDGGVPEAGVLPSTRHQPDWWKKPSEAGEAEASRSASITWDDYPGDAHFDGKANSGVPDVDPPL